jgi:hypothetical protein
MSNTISIPPLKNILSSVMNSLTERFSCLKSLELQDKSFAPEHCKTDYIQVKISKLTTLAVISRLITDRFEVTASGCVVTSSVCNDVTVEFPEGAVDKTVNGTMKVCKVIDQIFFM